MKTIKLVCQARHSFLLGFVILLCSKDLQTQGYEEHFHDWPVDLKINGTVFVSDAKTPSAEWMEKISVADTKPSILLLTDALGSERNEQLELLTQYAQSTDSVQIDGPLAAEVFASADCIIWMETRSANEIPQETVDRLKTLFFKHIEQGKTLCVFGPQAKMLSRFFINKR